MIVAERARRADAGVIRLMPRDAEALAWIGSMRAIEAPDLGVLLGRLAGREPLTEGAVTSVVKRWRALGVVEARRIIVGGPQIVTLTAQGHELVGEPGRWSPVSWTQITHTTAVARARLLVEASWSGVTEWISERRWRREHEDLVKSGAHIPDGVVRLTDERAFAIEVELTPKSNSRTDVIIHKLITSEMFDGAVYYVGSEALGRSVQAHIDRVQARFTGGYKRNPVRVALLPADLREYLSTTS